MSASATVWLIDVFFKDNNGALWHKAKEDITLCDTNTIHVSRKHSLLVFSCKKEPKFEISQDFFPSADSCCCVSLCQTLLLAFSSFWLPSSEAVGLWVYVCLCLCVCCADASVCQYLHSRLADSGCHLPPFLPPSSLGMSGASDFALGFGFWSRNTPWLTSIRYLQTPTVKINRRSKQGDTLGDPYLSSLNVDLSTHRRSLAALN